MTSNIYNYSKQIGEGSFGKIFIGENRLTKKEVAIKINTCTEINALEHECKILHRLQKHKNIPKMYWYGKINNSPALVLELLSKSLKEIRENDGKLNSEQTKLYCTDMFTAIEYIHKKNFIHRDIKPENFMLKNNN